jgi:hypothetical protein
MLTQDQKEAILRSAGIDVPAWANGSSLPGSDGQHKAHGWARAAQVRAHAINDLFEAYVAQRAARSLREAEEARQLADIRRESDR